MKKILFGFVVTVLMVFNSYSLAQKVDGDLAAFLIMRDLRLNVLPSSVQVIPQNAPDSQSDLYKVILNHDGAGRIQMRLKGPRGFLSQTETPYRGLMIVSGFFTGDQSIHLLGDIPNRILIGLEYPYGIKDFQNDPGSILQFVRKTPGQIALALQWLSSQPWIKPHGLAVMGVSLGGVFLPSGLHLSQELGTPLEKAIYVCTGSDLNLILSENLKSYTLDQLLMPLVRSLVAPTMLIDPKIHLPYLRGKSIVVQTNKDTVIPRYSQIDLIKNLPEPKREIILQGPHINPDQHQLIQSIQETILKLENE